MQAYPRKCSLIHFDAIEFRYDWYLDSLHFPDTLDYLSIDIDPNVNTLACMRRLLLMPRRFSVITFETNHYAGNESGNSASVRSESRDIIKAFDYELIAGNISAFDDDDHPLEDWYFDKKSIDSQTIEKFKRTSDESISAYKYMFSE